MEILKTDSVDTAVTTLFGDGLRITGRRPVYGGDINQSYRLSLSDGSTLFMKCNSVRNLPFFTAEAQGLAILRGTGAIGIPKPLALGMDQTQGVSFLLMEYLSLLPKATITGKCLDESLRRSTAPSASAQSQPTAV